MEKEIFPIPWVLMFCISNKFSSGADAAGPGTNFENP